MSTQTNPAYPRFLPGLDDDYVTRVWIGGALLMIALLVSTLPAYYLDIRTIDGVSVWMKPIKFQLSLGLQFVTVALLAQLVTRPARTSIAFTAGTYIAAAALIFEIIYMMVQAGRGRRSHFNLDTEFEAMMYSFMGIGAVFLVVMPMILAVLIWRQRDGAREDGKMTGLRLGAILGLILSGVLTLIVAGYMSNSMSHWVGQTKSDANGLPLLGWSREVGDLRVAHFFATHTLQALPLLGLIADRSPAIPAIATVWIGAALSAGLTLAFFLQALAGQPLIP